MGYFERKKGHVSWKAVYILSSIYWEANELLIHLFRHNIRKEKRFHFAHKVEEGEQKERNVSKREVVGGTEEKWDAINEIHVGAIILPVSGSNDYILHRKEKREGDEKKRNKENRTLQEKYMLWLVYE